MNLVEGNKPVTTFNRSCKDLKLTSDIKSQTPLIQNVCANSSTSGYPKIESLFKKTIGGTSLHPMVPAPHRAP